MRNASRHLTVPGLAATILLLGLLPACDADPTSSGALVRDGSTDADPTASGGPVRDGSTRTPRPSRTCDLDGDPLRRIGQAAEATVLLDGDDGGPSVEAVVYPHPDHEGNPWSQWGQGLLLPDGRFLSAIGDHLGADGNSYVYEYAPDSGALTLLTDVLTLTEHEPGAWGYGKIHAPMVPGPCGEVYFSTYWGSSEHLAFGPTYQGDRLFRIDPVQDTVADLGTPVPRHGLPSLNAWVEGGILYGEAPDPLTDPWEGPFFVYDMATGETVFEDDDRGHVGFRSVAVDADGRAYYSVGNGVLRVYDPLSGETRDLPDLMPGPWMRSSTPPAPDGTIFAVTTEPDVFFAIEPSGKLRTLGPARGYSASLALHPDGERVLYVPGAHGDSWEQGTPLIEMDPQTGEERVLVELNAAAEAVLGLRLGGTYDLAVDASRRTVFIGMNAGAASSGEPFGEVVLLVVHLP